jgi:hypothetical protein
MIADADLQVWLDAQPQAQQIVMVPYVKSVKDIQMSYQVDLVQKSGAGTSRVSQKGKVNVTASQPAALGRVTVGIQKEGECRIEIALNENNTELGTYRFDCPR